MPSPPQSHTSNSFPSQSQELQRLDRRRCRIHLPHSLAIAERSLDAWRRKFRIRPTFAASVVDNGVGSKLHAAGRCISRHVEPFHHAPRTRFHIPHIAERVFNARHHRHRTHRSRCPHSRKPARRFRATTCHTRRRFTRAIIHHCIRINCTPSDPCSLRCMRCHRHHKHRTRPPRCPRNRRRADDAGPSQMPHSS